MAKKNLDLNPEQKRKRKKMSKEEKIEWDNLYNYVRKNIMGYDENQSLSNEMVLRLKGLLNNKFMANNNVANTANYSYTVVLNTFKYCMPDIQNGLRTISFRDERHKMNYIMKIVESNLNTVYVKMKNAEKNKRDISTINIPNIPVATNSNISKPKKEVKEKPKNKYSDLW